MSASIHHLADVQSSSIGDRTRIGQFCVVEETAIIGVDCTLGPGVLVEKGVVIEDNVRIDGAAQLRYGACVESGVFIGANVCLAMPPIAYVGMGSGGTDKTVVRRGAAIAANAVIASGVEIGEHALVRAGSVVTRSVPANAIVTGSPATIVGYVDTAAPSSDGPSVSVAPSIAATSVRGVTVHNFPIISDSRGSLSVGEFDRHVPFVPMRFFMTYDVPSLETRGAHAHRACHEFLICVRGACAIVVDDGERRMEIGLDSPRKGVYLPPMVWRIQYKYTQDALVLVFASHYYDPGDYIREYRSFLDEVGRRHVQAGL